MRSIAAAAPCRISRELKIPVEGKVPEVAAGAFLLCEVVNNAEKLTKGIMARRYAER